MKLFRCKSCNADLNIEDHEKIVVCQYCNSTQVIPNFDDDEKSILLDRADHYTKNYEFDKAIDLYNEILTRFGNDADCYFRLVLCEYGIMYEKDSATKSMVPTINRMQYTSIYADANYQKAIELADDASKEIYEREAARLDDIQRNILKIVEKEDPYDIFICYKETDQFGRRTQDSVYANEIYHELSEEGYRVFFARITLEDKLGKDYESYIFSALNSAKIMITLATDVSYLESAWVKNEWMRYLKFIRNGEKKTIIPVYSGFSALDLPKELAFFNCMDINELGFLDELVRGIKKIIPIDANQTPVTENTTVLQVQNNQGLLTAPEYCNNAFKMLEMGKWEEASMFLEDCLNLSPKYAKAYLGKIMVSKKAKNFDCFFQSILQSDSELIKQAQYKAAMNVNIRNLYHDYLISDIITEKNIRELILELNYLPMEPVTINDLLYFSTKETHLYEHFIHFSKEDPSEEFEKLNDFVVSSLERVNHDIEMINQAKEQIRPELEQKLIDRLEYQRSFYWEEDKEDRYQEAIYLLNTGNRTDMKKALSILKRLETYKMSEQICSDTISMLKKGFYSEYSHDLRNYRMVEKSGVITIASQVEEAAEDNQLEEAEYFGGTKELVIFVSIIVIILILIGIGTS